MLEIGEVRQILDHDMNSDLVQWLSNYAAWEYHQLYEEIDARSYLTNELKNSEFSKRQSNCLMQAMARACQKCGVPYDFRRLTSNGQYKIIAKMGRIVLITEAMHEFPHRPEPADYKRELASGLSVIRQLELDLGDQPRRVLDWCGEVLAVVLHGAVGTQFNRRDKSLGGLMLAVPDAVYQSWLVRFDLHALAMFGTGGLQEQTMTKPAGAQVDRVTVSLKPGVGVIGVRR